MKPLETVESYKAKKATGRAADVKSYCRQLKSAKTLLAKVLVAGEMAGDFLPGNGGMQSYCSKLTAHPLIPAVMNEDGSVKSPAVPAYPGIDLRRDVQGTYEACNVLRALLAGKLAMVESEFDWFPSFGLIKLSSFMSKEPTKVADALEIIRSGVDVTNRLRALASGPVAPVIPESPESDDSGDGGGGGEGETEEVETTGPAGISYFVEEGTPILNDKAILARIVAEIKGAETLEDCNEYRLLFSQLEAYIESREEVLEAEEAAADLREVALV